MIGILKYFAAVCLLIVVVYSTACAVDYQMDSGRGDPPSTLENAEVLYGRLPYDQLIRIDDSYHGVTCYAYQHIDGVTLECIKTGAF